MSAALVTAVATAAGTDTWKFASEEDKGDVQDIFAQAFAESIKEQSGGDIKVRIYYYGQLGTENDIVELTSKGTVQFVSVGTGHLGSYVPEVQALSLPYVLGSDTDVIREVLTTSPSIYNELNEKFEKVNLKLLTMISEGEMAWGANKEIRSPADFDGQKIRTFTSIFPVETFKSFGDTPTPLCWGEVYGALQLKTVDGMVYPLYFTPPFGCDIFTAIAIFSRRYLEVIRGTVPFFLILALMTAMLIYFPGIALFLRDLAGF